MSESQSDEEQRLEGIAEKIDEAKAAAGELVDKNVIEDPEAPADPPVDED